MQKAERFSSLDNMNFKIRQWQDVLRKELMLYTLFSLFSYLMTFLTAATEAASRTSRKAKEFCLTSPRMTEVSWSVSPGLSPCRPTLLPSWSPDVSTVARSCTTALQNKHRTMGVVKWCLGPPYIWNRNSPAP